jgi:hypothetical protein
MLLPAAPDGERTCALSNLSIPSAILTQEIMETTQIARKALIAALQSPEVPRNAHRIAVDEDGLIAFDPQEWIAWLSAHADPMLVEELLSPRVGSWCNGQGALITSLYVQRAAAGPAREQVRSALRVRFRRVQVIASSLHIHGDLRIDELARLIVMGDLTIDGSLQLHQDASLHVLGNLTIANDLVDHGTCSQVVVCDDATIHGCTLSSGHLLVGGSLRTPFLHASLSRGRLVVLGDLHSLVALEEDHAGSVILGQLELGFALSETLDALRACPVHEDRAALRALLAEPKLVKARGDLWEIAAALLDRVDAGHAIFSGSGTGWMYANSKSARVA